MVKKKMQGVSKEVEEGTVRFAALSGTSGECRMAADDLEDEIQILQGRKEEAAVRRSPTDVALIQPWWSRSSLVKQYILSITSKPCNEELIRRFKAPAALETMTMTMTHSEKSHICQMKAWPYRQECRS